MQQLQAGLVGRV